MEEMHKFNEKGNNFSKENYIKYMNHIFMVESFRSSIEAEAMRSSISLSFKFNEVDLATCISYNIADVVVSASTSGRNCGVM